MKEVLGTQPCGCDPAAAWHCSVFPDCSYGRNQGGTGIVVHAQELTRQTNPRAEPIPLTPGSSEMSEAHDLVNGDRQASYGSPRANYEGIAKVWSGLLAPILKRDITPEEAALMMVGLKIQRQAMHHKRDNLVDAHGYLLVYSHVQAGAK